MILPNNGRIVIIDDKEEEGIPLFRALTKEGHLATFFTEWKEGLPKKPMRGIRVVFLDLILGNEYQAEKTILSTILNVLNKVIDKKENGPFMLVAWTNRPSEAEAVETKLKLEGFKFLMTVLQKQDCQNASGNFSVRKIQTKLRESIKKVEALQLFILWENLIHQATGKIVRDFSDLADMDDKWNEKMETVIAKLAKSVLGGHFDPTKPKEVIDNAMFSMNTALVDAINQETKYSPKTSNLELKIPEIKDKREMTLSDGAINSSLLLKGVIDAAPIPGTIYTNNLTTKVSVEKLFNGKQSDKEQLLEKVKHIVLEVTPACDYAEKKSLVNRLLPGVIWPHSLVDTVKKGSEFTFISPVLKDGKDNLFHFVFDFRVFTSVGGRDLLSKKPIFCIQDELLADIQSKLSKHVSRLGVVSVG